MQCCASLLNPPADSLSRDYLYAKDILYRQAQGGRLNHSNHFVVAVEDVPFIFWKKNSKGRNQLFVKGGTCCFQIALVISLPVSLQTSVSQISALYTVYNLSAVYAIC